LARAGLPSLLALSRDHLPRAAEIGLDVRVLVFTAVVATLAAVLFGLVPALRASRPDLNEVLKGTARGSTGERARLRHGLVVAEVALALTLLTGGGLLMKSFSHLAGVSRRRERVSRSRERRPLHRTLVRDISGRRELPARIVPFGTVSDLAATQETSPSSPWTMSRGDLNT